MPFKKLQHPQNIEKVTFKKPPVLCRHQIFRQLLKLIHWWLAFGYELHNITIWENFLKLLYTRQGYMKAPSAPTFLNWKTSKWHCSSLVNIRECVCVCVCMVCPCETVLLLDWHSPYSGTWLSLDLSPTLNYIFSNTSYIVSIAYVFILEKKNIKMANSFWDMLSAELLTSASQCQSSELL